jgi:hypothetical protein
MLGVEQSKEDSFAEFGEQEHCIFTEKPKNRERRNFALSEGVHMIGKGENMYRMLNLVHLN